jgi:hypothetical protein
MGVEIKLTDRELPVSPVFIDFLVHVVEGRPWPETNWHDQLSEDLTQDHKGVVERAADNAKRVMASKDGQRHIGRAYQYLVGLLTGNLELIREVQFKYHFINVIGIPRNGGSYLTMEAYRALGYDPTRVPNVIAHDGFPEAGPFRFEKGINSWVTSLQTMAEFLTMVELYFGDAKPHFGKVVVPKKLLKGTYAGGFFHRILGESVENVLTVRHPVACAISTYEKSGGLPEDGRFRVRGNIEEWARRDLTYTRFTNDELFAMDYFDAYLRYWEQYHYYIATTGLSANRNVTVTPFTAPAMLATSRRFHARFESGLEPSAFKVFDKRDRHPDWVAKATPVVQRVAEVWERAGLRFPLDEVNQMW